MADEQTNYLKAAEFRALLETGADPEDVYHRLRVLPRTYYDEAVRKVNLTHLTARTKIRLDERKDELYMEHREQLEATGKKMTEATLSSAVALDAIVRTLTKDLEVNRRAEQMQDYRLAAMEMESKHLLKLAEAYRLERTAYTEG